ncbi:MAG: acyl-CoA dehydrogenase, partial [Rhizobiales bacterium]|nr:acyl-CoA dehydrogenase [Hyphomicrobiales bacterium]
MSAVEDFAPAGPVLEGLTNLTREAVEAVQAIYGLARQRVAIFVTGMDGKISPELLERDQHSTHGLAWLATYAQTLEQMSLYAERMEAEGRFGELEALLVQACFGEYLNQINGGIPMSQVEMVRPSDLGLTW